MVANRAGPVGGFLELMVEHSGDIQLSIIAPAFNEVDNVGPLVERIHAVFTPLGY